MPILPSNTLLNYSTSVGSIGNSNAGTSVGSLGKFISNTTITPNTFLNLFPSLTGDQNIAGNVDYLCVFILNTHPTLTWIAPKLWLSNKTAAATNIAVGLDPTGVSSAGSSSVQAVSVANTALAPAGVVFSNPTSKASGLTIGDLAPNKCAAMWFRRTANNTGPINPDVFWTNIEGDSGQ